MAACCSPARLHRCDKHGRTCSGSLREIPTVSRIFSRFRHEFSLHCGLRLQCQHGPMVLSIQNNPRRLWRKLQTTNAIGSYFVEVRRPTRPMVVFTDVENMDRIIYVIFSHFDGDWKPHSFGLLT